MSLGRSLGSHGPLRRRSAVAVCVGVAGVSAGLAAATLPAHAAITCSRVLVSSCSAAYEIDYAGSETLSTLPATSKQPFYQAGRTLHVKLKWDFKVFRDYKTSGVVGREAKASGFADLTIPDNTSLDCTTSLKMAAADANAELDNTYVNLMAGPKVLVWTAGLPRRVSSSCNDSSPAPVFTAPGFQARYDKITQPRFTVSCSELSKLGGTKTEKFDFTGKSAAELSTVGLGKVAVTIRSTVSLKRLKCATGNLLAP